MKILKIYEHGVMLSDYFCGTNGVMLPIHIDNTTTIKEVISRLKNEINQIWDHIESTAQYHKFDSNLEKAINSEIDKIKEFCKNKMNKVFDNSLDWNFNENDENEIIELDYPVLIFTIEFEDF